MKGGSPLSLDDIMKTSLFLHRSLLEAQRTAFAVQEMQSTFPLLSQGDHPTLGSPCWYFHPCETPKALVELIEEEEYNLGKEPDVVRKLELWLLLLGNVFDLTC